MIAQLRPSRTLPLSLSSLHCSLVDPSFTCVQYRSEWSSAMKVMTSLGFGGGLEAAETWVSLKNGCLLHVALGDKSRVFLYGASTGFRGSRPAYANKSHLADLRNCASSSVSCISPNSSGEGQGRSSGRLFWPRLSPSGGGRHIYNSKSICPRDGSGQRAWPWVLLLWCVK